MKKLLYLFVAIAVVSFTACQDDDDNFDLYTLNHDGANADAPALPAGSYEAAAHFTRADVERHAGTELVAIEYFIRDKPAYAEVRISPSDGSNQPGTNYEFYDVTNELTPFSWNTLQLPFAKSIEEGLWLSVYFESVVDDQRIIGCDGGPAALNGDWLYDDYDQTFQTYEAREGVSINWNIRGVLRDR